VDGIMGTVHVWESHAGQEARERGEVHLALFITKLLTGTYWVPSRTYKGMSPNTYLPCIRPHLLKVPHHL
jgi:hypothetical protein